MIGELVFYMENNSICSSKIASMYKKDDGIWVTLESKASFWQSDLCFSIEELYKKLIRDYRKRVNRVA